jgi:hypothetical protein
MSVRQPIRRPNITVNCSVHGVAVLHKLHNLGANQGPRCPCPLVYNSTSNSSTGRDGVPGHRLQLKFSQSHSSGLRRNQSTKNSHWTQEFMSHNGHIPKTLKEQMIWPEARPMLSTSQWARCCSHSHSFSCWAFLVGLVEFFKKIQAYQIMHHDFSVIQMTLVIVNSSTSH